jgi:hypothetical protein
LLVLNCSNEVWRQSAVRRTFRLSHMAMSRRGLHATDIADKLLW